VVRLVTFCLASLLVVAGCATKAGVGSACVADKDCKAPLGCVGDPFPGGHCTQDCSAEDCPEGRCGLIGGRSWCLRECTDPSGCRDGYQCWQGVCQPPCQTDPDCGPGFQCASGQCAPFDGAAPGEPCGVDTDCNTRTCVKGTCRVPCDRDQLCGDNQTCGLEPVPAPGNPPEGLRPLCMARRGGGTPGTACQDDTDCDRGACQLGLCVELCTTSADCHQSGMACNQLTALLDSGELDYKGCLPRTGRLVFDPFDNRLTLPSSTQALALFVRSPTQSLTEVVGVTSFTDPGGTQLYKQPGSVQEFFELAIRYQPAEGTSTMLVPNTSRVLLKGGLYDVTVATGGGFVRPTTTAYVKLGPSPPASGTAVLTFYIPALSGGCNNVTVANAPQLLADVADRVKTIFSQANVEVTSVLFKAAGAGTPSTLQADSDTGGDQLDQLLLANTRGQTADASFDVVLVRSITNGMGQPSGILGIAGGVPSSPTLGTPHSGVVVSVQTWCGLGDQLFAEVIAHELGHSVGLFHNEERDGNVDPLDDTGTQTSNLMFWQEMNGANLTAQQGQVIRNDPKVKP
jgi:hypothetical protein